MIECESTLRKWGNSVCVVIPKDVVESEHLKEEEKIKFLILRDNKVLKETFGMMKGRWKKSTQDIKDQLRKELYNE